MKWHSIESFSAPKQGHPSATNEDAYHVSDSVLVLSDGATCKADKPLDFSRAWSDIVGGGGGDGGDSGENITGGKLASSIVVQVAKQTELNGREFVDKVTQLIDQSYQSALANYNPDTNTTTNTTNDDCDNNNSINRPAATVALARIVGENVHFTLIGSNSIRINYDITISSIEPAEIVNATIRADHIRSTGDIQAGREAILPNLKQQFKLRNNAQSEHGYGALDGTYVPDKFIKYIVLPIVDVQFVELVSDGYYGYFPGELSSVGKFEEYHQWLAREDPDKCRSVLATKSDDDRTVVIARLS